MFTFVDCGSSMSLNLDRGSSLLVRQNVGGVRSEPQRRGNTSFQNRRRKRQQLALLFFILTITPVAISGDYALQRLNNAGFESSIPAESWRISDDEAKQSFSMTIEKSDVKEGKQALLIQADAPVQLTLRQEVFLPVGKLWQLTGWLKSDAVVPSDLHSVQADQTRSGPQIGIEAQVGDQGHSAAIDRPADWQQARILFRVPSPGRMTIALRSFHNQKGKVWLDDIRLQPVPEPLQTEQVMISGDRLSKRPIDLKQGGQFMEPLCDVLPSMTAQQVNSTSFEEETPWNFSYRAAVDKPYRPWYPEGSVHVANYSFDTNNAFNGKRSQKIELPLANTWAGISQDGFYVESGHSYRLRFHVRSEGAVALRAKLHGDGGLISKRALLRSAGTQWQGVEVLLSAKRTVSNATLTIEFKGPGTLWLDRIYLIDRDAVLGLWRPDVVQALEAMNPGIVRFGGSAIEKFEWSDTVGNWDSRVPFPDDPWGGLQENFVGVEEFVQLVRHIGAEPLICLRWTNKTPQEVADEVEYFNGPPDSRWGQLRAKNGHPEPYHVKYWEVGNEVGGDEYDSSLAAFAQTMRRVDASIKILSSYPSRKIVRLAGRELDFLSPHQYSVGDLNGTEEELKELQEDIIQDGQGRDIRISVTEWNATAGDWGLKRGMLHTLGNALVCSRYQQMMHRYSDLIEIANLSNFSHSFAGGQVQPGPGYIYKIPDYYAQKLYQRAAGSFPLRIERSSPLSLYLREPDLDATLSANGKTLRIYGVNSTPESRSVRFALPSGFHTAGMMSTFTLADSVSFPDSEAMNSRDEPERVKVKELRVKLNGAEFEYGFPPFSVTLLELPLAGAK